MYLLTTAHSIQTETDLTFCDAPKNTVSYLNSLNFDLEYHPSSYGTPFICCSPPVKEHVTLGKLFASILPPPPPPHLQHCGYCFVFGVGKMAGFVFRAERCATVVFQLELFPLRISH